MPLPQHGEDILLVVFDGVQGIGLGVVRLDQIEGFSDAGQHAERQDIHLHETQVVDVVLVPFDKGAVRHGPIVDGHDLVQPTPRQDKTADMLAEVTGEVQQARGHLHRARNHWIGGVHAGLFDMSLGDIRAPTAPVTGGETCGHILAEPQNLADFTDGAAGAEMDNGGGDARAMSPIILVKILDDLFAPLVFEIHVNVGRFAATG